MTEQTRKRKRPLGARPQRAATSAVDNLGVVLEEYSAGTDFIERNQIHVAFFRPDDIKKTFNARFIPCTLEEFAAVEWPSLDLDAESAMDLYPALLQSEQWYKQLSEAKQGEFIQFLGEIHMAAQSIATSRQIQPITVERNGPTSNEVFVVAGERRTLACLYSRGVIPFVRAQVYDHLLDDELRARIKDEENLVVSLKPFELLESKLARLEANPSLCKLPVRALGKELHVNRNYAVIIRGIALHPERDKLRARIRDESLRWRDMQVLLDHGPDAILQPRGSDDDLPRLPGNVSSGVTEPSRVPQNIAAFRKELRSMSKKLEDRIGYSCRINYDPNKEKVRLSIDCDSDKLDQLLSLIRDAADEESSQ